MTKIKLDNELARLENLCQKEEAQEKIALLAAGILHKNLKIAQEYEEAKKLVADLSEKLQVAEKRFHALKNNYASKKQNRLYRVIQPVNDSAKTTLKQAYYFLLYFFTPDALSSIFFPKIYHDFLGFFCYNAIGE